MFTSVVFYLFALVPGAVALGVAEHVYNSYQDKKYREENASKWAAELDRRRDASMKKPLARVTDNGIKFRSIPKEISAY